MRPAVADRLTYRPGWTFADELEGIRIRWAAPNSADPLEYVQLEVLVRVGELEDEAAIVAAVYEALESIDRHERAEWFRLDGSCIDGEAWRAHPGWHTYYPGETP